MYITVNDLKAVYILILDSKKGVIHTNYKYTLLAVDKKGVIYLYVKYLKRFYACNKSITFYHNRKDFYPVFFTGDKFNGVLAPMRKLDNCNKTIIYPVKGGE